MEFGRLKIRNLIQIVFDLKILLNHMQVRSYFIHLVT
jgi:hypothetical protein